MADLVEEYRRFAATYYRRADGTPTGEIHAIRDALRALERLFGLMAAGEFGPRALQHVRTAMIETGLTRALINRRIGIVKRLFKWAVANELVPPSLHHGLQAVTGLRRGRTDAREAVPVKPVLEAHVDAVLPFVTPPVRAMIELQRLTGMRPGEVVIMRPVDIDRSGAVWTYAPSHHKTAHHGIERRIALGPRGQAVLEPFLAGRPATAFLFSPAEASAWRIAEARRCRESRVTPSQAARRPKPDPRRAPRERYDVDSYRRAIARAARRARVPHWHPNQIRHTVATRLRKEFGLEAAAAILGHHLLETTQIYAESHAALASRIMGDVG